MSQTHPERPCIGQLLVSGGFVQPDQLKRAVALNQVYHKRIGEILEDEKAIAHEDTLAVLHLQEHLDSLDIERDANGSLPQKLQLNLGQILLENGQITREQLDEALAEHQRDHRPLGETLVSHQWISEQALSHWLDVQKKLVAAASAALLMMGMAGTAHAGDFDERPFEQAVSQLSADLSANLTLDSDNERRFLHKDIETNERELGEFAFNEAGSALLKLSKNGVEFSRTF